MLKNKTIRKYYGLEYVTVDLPFTKTGDRWTVHAETIRQTDELICLQILSREFPIRGKEVRFIRKALGISMQMLGAMLELSPTAIMKWEKKENVRLERVNELAFRSVILGYMNKEQFLEDAFKAAMKEIKKAPKLQIKGKKAA